MFFILVLEKELFINIFEILNYIENRIISRSAIFINKPAHVYLNYLDWPVICNLKMLLYFTDNIS